MAEGTRRLSAARRGKSAGEGSGLHHRPSSNGAATPPAGGGADRGGGATAAPAVGDRVRAGPRRFPGTCRFVGPVEFSPGEWIGIQLDEALGKNDGTVQGKRYFTCPANCGIFVKQNQVFRYSDEEITRHLQAVDTVKSVKKLGSGGGHGSHAANGSDVIRLSSTETQAGKSSSAAANPQGHDDEPRSPLAPPALSRQPSATAAAAAATAADAAAQRMLVLEVDAVRSAVVRLTEALEAVEARARAVERALVSGGLEVGPKPAAAPEGPALKALVKDVALQVHEQVWAQLETRIRRTISEAMKEAQNAVSAIADGTLARLAAPAAADKGGGPAPGAKRVPAAAAAPAPDPPPKGAAAAPKAQPVDTRAAEVQDVYKLQDAAARKLQGAWRRHGHPQVGKGLAQRLRAQNADLVEIFAAAAGMAERLNLQVFTEALQDAQPGIRRSQAQELFRGYCAGMGVEGVDLAGFVAICKAVASGDQAASRFTRLSLAEYRRLGLTGDFGEPDVEAAMDAEDVFLGAWGVLEAALEDGRLEAILKQTGARPAEDGAACRAPGPPLVDP